MQSAGQAGLDQVLLLVEVDVELVEPGDLAALGGTNGIVGQVDEKPQELVLHAILVGAGQALELLGSVDVADVQGGGQVGLGVVDAATVQVACRCP